jgi:NAD(P)-dependent dehydrogenase (short-subunit alcohol dehydrogenase family)
LPTPRPIGYGRSEVNFFAAAELIRESLPILSRGNHPIVVNIGSILGHRATPRNSEYCASKFALRGLTESLRPELAHLGIDLLLVSPGTTESEFYSHVINAQEKPPWPEQKAAPAVAPAGGARSARAGDHPQHSRLIGSTGWHPGSSMADGTVWLTTFLHRVLAKI